MPRRYLGDEFDIHDGDTNLRFSHHENGQAQSHDADWEFTRLWVYNAQVTTKGKKMPKPPGSVPSIGVLTGECPAVAVRWALSTVRHRPSIEWGVETLPVTHAAWEKFSTFVAHATETVGEAPTSEVTLAPADLPKAFAAVMDDDLNAAGALAALHGRLKAGNAALTAGDVSGVYHERILACSTLGVLDLDPASEQWRGQAGIGAGASGAATAEHSALDVLAQAVLGERVVARAAKDWTCADELRDRLATVGVIVTDERDGATRSVG